MNIGLLISILTKAISYAYRKDPTSPNLTISVLKNGQYYCSIVRYTESLTKGKVVVCNVESDKLKDAVKAVTLKFLTCVVPEMNPIDQLRDLMNKGGK